MIRVLESTDERRLVIDAPTAARPRLRARRDRLPTPTRTGARASKSPSAHPSTTPACSWRGLPRNPKSGPYRLVEYVTTIKRTKEVIE
jgi:hypothetical protein